jgi:hypothetical protein
MLWIELCPIHTTNKKKKTTTGDEGTVQLLEIHYLYQLFLNQG